MQLGRINKRARKLIFEYYNSLGEKQKEKIRKSFYYCPANWRDNYSKSWRLRYSQEILEQIGKKYKLQKLVKR